MNKNRKVVLSLLASHTIQWMPSTTGYIGMTPINDPLKPYFGAYGLLWLGAAIIDNSITIGPTSMILDNHHIIGVAVPNNIMSDVGHAYLRELYELTEPEMQQLLADESGDFGLLRVVLGDSGSTYVPGTGTKQ